MRGVRGMSALLTIVQLAGVNYMDEGRGDLI